MKMQSIDLKGLRSPSDVPELSTISLPFMWEHPCSSTEEIAFSRLTEIDAKKWRCFHPNMRDAVNGGFT
jgi:hypothetical protein